MVAEGFPKGIGSEPRRCNDPAICRQGLELLDREVVIADHHVDTRQIQDAAWPLEVPNRVTYLLDTAPPFADRFLSAPEPCVSDAESAK